jgi:probable rRNA maturation factor
MPFSAAVLDEVSYGKLSPERATTLFAAAFVARGLDLDRLGEVSVVLVPLDLIQQLNLKHRDIDSPTDVLSFEIDGPYGEMFGEVVISPEYVGFDRAGVEELVVHGALHLAGMDHGEDFEGSEMATAQRDVLGGTGVGEG